MTVKHGVFEAAVTGAAALTEVVAVTDLTTLDLTHIVLLFILLKILLKLILNCHYQHCYLIKKIRLAARQIS